MIRELIFKRKANKMSQMELGIERRPEPDRNFSRGGRSFYFFDFDDNVAFLTTKIFIFSKQSGAKVALSSSEYAEQSPFIGRSGIYKDFEVKLDDEKGSFRHFRDADLGLLAKLIGKRQPFIEDLAHALGFQEFHWKGPSWSCFYHAVYNGRPISVITARGHHPDTIKQGISLLLDKGHLPYEPNYLSLYPVSHPQIQLDLGFKQRGSVAEMKKAAIRASVLKAFELYGYNDHHRFGMSDDDPQNIELITEEMSQLKIEYPEISFFVIKTCKGEFIKREIFSGYTLEKPLDSSLQMSLFDR